MARSSDATARQYGTWGCGRGLDSAMERLGKIRTAPKTGHNRIPTKVDRVDMIHHQNGVTQPTSGDALSAYHAFVRVKGSNKVARSFPPIEVPQVRILVADSGLIQSQLLAR